MSKRKTSHVLSVVSLFILFNLIYHFTRTKLKYCEFLLSYRKVALSPFTIINVALLFHFTPCIPKIPTLKLYFCFEEIKINNLTSWHIYMTRGSNFQCIRQFILSQKSGWGEELKILNTNPYRFIPLFQGIKK